MQNTAYSKRCDALLVQSMWMTDQAKELKRISQRASLLANDMEAMSGKCIAFMAALDPLTGEFKEAVNG